MASGTYVAYDKKQPGVYFDRRIEKQEVINRAPEGIVLYPASFQWGERDTIIELNSLQDCFKKLGYKSTDPEMRPIVEMFRGSNRTQGANKIYVIIPNVEGQTKANTYLDAGSVEIQAQCYGTLGNHIVITVIPDLDTPYDDGGSTPAYAVKTVQTIVDGIVVDSQTYGSYIDETHYVPAKYGELKDNEFVKFIVDGSEDAAIGDYSGVHLEGGYSPEPTDVEMVSFIPKLENTFFQVMCYDGESNAVKSAYENFIKRLYDDKGYFCQLVVSDFTADFEGTTVIENGLKLSDGTTLDEKKVTWWYSGCSAGAKPNQSLTHIQHPLAIDVTKEYTNDEKNAFIDEGKIVFVKEFNIPVLMKDINSLHTFTEYKKESLKSNKLLRTINYICNYCNYQYNLYYIGDIPQNDNGRNLVKGNVLGLLRVMEADQAIQNVKESDVEVYPIEVDNEAIEIICGIEGVGALEKIYFRLTAH